METLLCRQTVRGGWQNIILCQVSRLLCHRGEIVLTRGGKADIMEKNRIYSGLSGRKTKKHVESVIGMINS